VGASRFVVAQLQPIERRGAGQRIASIVLAAPIQAQRVALVCGQREERVAAQRVMIVEILVTDGQAQHALGQEQQPRLYVYFPLPLAAAIGLNAGDEVTWELLDRGELHLVRDKVSAPPPP
jgi:hypothetical protein